MWAFKVPMALQGVCIHTHKSFVMNVIQLTIPEFSRLTTLVIQNWCIARIFFSKHDFTLRKFHEPHYEPFCVHDRINFVWSTAARFSSNLSNFVSLCTVLGFLSQKIYPNPCFGITDKDIIGLPNICFVCIKSSNYIERFVILITFKQDEILTLFFFIPKKEDTTLVLENRHKAKHTRYTNPLCFSKF